MRQGSVTISVGKFPVQESKSDRCEISTLHYGKLGGLDRHLGEANFKQFWAHFKGFWGVNFTQRLLEACLPPNSYTKGRPLEPLKLL